MNFDIQTFFNDFLIIIKISENLNKSNLLGY